MGLDVSEQVRRFKDFFESQYHKALLKQFRSGKGFVIVDFFELSKTDPDLAELLLEQPEEVIKAAEIAVEEFDVPKDIVHFRVRFSNLPSTQKVMIRDIRARHIGGFIAVSGLIRQKSDVRPQMVSARFECPSCGNIMQVLQIDTQFREPHKCGCGRKGKFRLLSKDLVDVQRVVLEESPEELGGGAQPKRIDVFLREDLVSPFYEKKTNPGSSIIVNGCVKEIPIISRTGTRTTRFDLIMEANHVALITEDFTELQISKEDEDRIKEYARNPKIYDMLIESIAPSIYGHERVKEAITLQLFGAPIKQRTDGVKTRGDIHILLIGDPGAGKSQLLKRIQHVAPKSRYVSGKAATSAGLTATVVKDEFLRGWALEAGALVLANKGLCCIDELDKMTKEDRSAMHEALEQQTVTVAKANVQATLLAQTTVLAAANPKFGRFDPYDIVANQIELPPTLINRFDLIFPIKDLPIPERDERMASFILNLHKNTDMKEPEIDTDTIKKYVAYARQNIRPKLTDGAIAEIKSYYLKMRASGGDEGSVRSIPISARQLEALVRLSEASARVRLGSTVTKKDAKRAVDLLHYCLIQVGMDPDTGKIDIDRISVGVSASQRSQIFIIKEIINDLENHLGKTIPVEDIVESAKEKGMDSDKVDEVLEKLKRTGDIYEPRRGFISKLG